MYALTCDWKKIVGAVTDRPHGAKILYWLGFRTAGRRPYKGMTWLCYRLLEINVALSEACGVPYKGFTGVFSIARSAYLFYSLFSILSYLIFRTPAPPPPALPAVHRTAPASRCPRRLPRRAGRSGSAGFWSGRG